MDKCSYFIKDRALFGSYPTQEGIYELENEGVIYFIDLTLPTEKKIVPYKTNFNYFSYPIKDRHIPENNWEFCCFIIQISTIIKELKNYSKIYIHCKGGHGRSGIVVACILSHIFSLPPLTALNYTSIAHSKRKIMKDKWRHIGAPQTSHQKSFVIFLCKFIKFYKTNRNFLIQGFSNFSLYEVYIPNRGIFPSAEAAIQSYKSNDEKYIESLKKCTNYCTLKMITSNIEYDKLDWEKKYPNILFKILKLKFDQHKNLKLNLLNTYLSPLIYVNKTDLISATNNFNNGKNLLGKLLMKLRYQYLKENYKLNLII
tara:strand:+ start:26807 stop:27748 length:942 start_codon:yes stop_codon:yes gene_type:complete